LPDRVPQRGRLLPLLRDARLAHAPGRARRGRAPVGRPLDARARAGRRGRSRTRRHADRARRVRPPPARVGHRARDRQGPDVADRRRVPRGTEERHAAGRDGEPHAAPRPPPRRRHDRGGSASPAGRGDRRVRARALRTHGGEAHLPARVPPARAGHGRDARRARVDAGRGGRGRLGGGPDRGGARTGAALRYFVITPQATRAPELPAGSVISSSGSAWMTSARPEASLSVALPTTLPCASLSSALAVAAQAEAGAPASSSPSINASNRLIGGVLLQTRPGLL